MNARSMNRWLKSGIGLFIVSILALPIVVNGCGGGGGASGSLIGRFMPQAPSALIGMARDAEFVCGEPSVQDLTAGRSTLIGTITISNDEDFLYVTFQTDDPWVLGTTHVHVGFHIDDVPKAGNGQPIPGQFDYAHERDVEGGEPAVTEDEYAIPFTDLGLESGECDVQLFIWAHAEAFQLDDDDVVIVEETAFGGDTPGDGTPRWFFLAEYTLQCCENGGGGGDFRTQTQGGWGTVCQGNNPGCYRDMWFDTAFPSGIVLGCDMGFVATFTSSQAVEDFLPTGGTPGALTSDVTDPTGTTDAGVLLAQLLALELSVGFDLFDPDFSVSEQALIDQIVCNTGTGCDGMTIEELLEEANIVVGGCVGSTGLSAGDLADCLMLVNENYVDGEVDLGMVCTFPTIQI